MSGDSPWRRRFRSTLGTTAIIGVSTAGLVAAIPVYPAVFVLPAVLLGLILLRRESARDEVMVVVGLAALGCAAQVGGHLLGRSTSPLTHSPVANAFADNPHGYEAPAGAENLLANSDLAWLRGWSEGADAGEYALPLEVGLWRIGATDRNSGVGHTEIRTLSEVAIEADTAYTLVVLLRHDGSRFDGDLVFRTRGGTLLPGTRLDPLDDGVLRASATLPPQSAPTRLRALHLARLGGDWSTLDIGFAQLTAGVAALPYRSRSHITAWHTGVLWWVALAGVLLTSAAVIRATVRSTGVAPITLGLLIGLALQTALVVGEAIAAGGAGPRASGSFVDPNVLAHVVIVAALAVGAISKRPLRDGALALTLAALSIWFSGSRAGLVGLVVGWTALIAVLPLRHSQRLSLGVAAALALAIGAAAATSTGSRLIEPLLDDPSVHSRIQAFETVLGLAVANPLTGVGHDNVGHHYEFTVPRRPGPRFRNEHGHSLLDLAASFGIPVALAFAVAVGLMARRLVRRGAAPAAIVLGVALLLNLLDLTLFNTALLLPVWIAYCVAVPVATRPQPSAAVLTRGAGDVRAG